MESNQLVLKSLLINALPLVFFALWASMRAEEYEAAEEDGDAEQIDPVEETGIVRAAAGVGVLAQGLAGLLAEATAPLPHHANLFLFVAGLLAQAQVRFGLEKRVRKLEATASQNIGAGLRSILSVGILLAAYSATVFFSAEGFAAIASHVGLSQNGVGIAKVFGTLVGVFGALALTFACGPQLIRRAIPSHRLEDPQAIALITDCFTKAGLHAPELWVIELDHFGAHNALVTGFTNGKGFFRPALFLSQSLLSRFRFDETQAVILHEVSHLQLGHMRKRFLLLGGSSIGSLVASAVLFAAAFLVLPKLLALPVSLVAAILPSLVPLLLVRRQVTRQEIEADRNAVLALGASFEAFASALRRLDQLNAVSSKEKEHQGRFCVSSGHPATEARIAMLEIALEGHNVDKAA